MSDNGPAGQRPFVKPNIVSHVRELLRLPPEWDVYLWQRVGPRLHENATRVEGAVCTELYQRGKYKGRKNWKKKDLGTVAVCVVKDDHHDEWLAEWEGKTGLCHKCSGTKEEWAGWSAAEGNRHQPCRRCGATGNAPLASSDTALPAAQEDGTDG